MKKFFDKFKERFKNSKILKKVLAFISVFAIVFSLVVIPSSAYSSGQVCQFYLEDAGATVFTFEYGQTWKTYINSSYNQYSGFVYSGDLVLKNGKVLNAKSSDLIEPGKTYNYSNLLPDSVSLGSIAPIYFYDFSGSVTGVAFPGAHSVDLYYNGTTKKDYISQTDFEEYPDRVKYGIFYDQFNVPYIQIYVSCNYKSIYANTDVFNGVSSSTQVLGCLVNPSFIDFRPVENSYTAGVTYYYTFNVLLGTVVDTDAVYESGFNAGVGSNQAKDRWYSNGYDEGFSDGVVSSQSSTLGQNLIGDTLSAPLKALNQFTLFTAPNGTDVTLGLVFGGSIGLILLLSFLKLFAGG